MQEQLVQAKNRELSQAQQQLRQKVVIENIHNVLQQVLNKYFPSHYVGRVGAG